MNLIYDLHVGGGLHFFLQNNCFMTLVNAKFHTIVPLMQEIKLKKADKTKDSIFPILFVATASETFFSIFDSGVGISNKD